MQVEASDELTGGKNHHLGLVGVPVVLLAGPPFLPPETAVGNGTAMGVTAEIGEDLIGLSKSDLA